MSCPRCTGRLIPDEDGKTCLQCGFVLYAHQDPSEVYWQQFQQRLQVIPDARPARLKAAGWRKRRIA